MKVFGISFLAVCALALSMCLLCSQAAAGQTSSSSSQAQPPAQQTSPPQTESSKGAGTVDASKVERTPRREAEMRADLLMARKEYADAAVAYEALVKQEPRNAQLVNKLGVAYHLQTKLDQAKKYYDRAAKLDPTFANAFNNLGTVYYQRKKYRKAVEMYRKALKVDPEMSVGFSNLGYAYFHLKKYDEAMDAFHRALAIDPEIFDRSSKVGSLLQDRTVLENRGLFNFFLAKSFAVQGDAVRCAQYLRKAIEDGYPSLPAARTDAAFKPVLRDPTVRELLQLEPLPPEPKSNGATSE
jgi:tetratricopeptide (TPR) repeat protein